MTNISDSVKVVIERDGAIRNDLARGLINIRALARYVQQRVGEEGEVTSLDAIISAIRRYPVQESVEVHQRIGRLLQKLTMRNKIVDISIMNDPEIPSALGKIASQIDYSRGETFRIVAGVESIRVVVDEKNLDKLHVIPKSKVLKVVRNLAEIIVSLSEVAEHTPGVVSTVTTELAMNGINMIEFMSCVPELVLVVEEKDALRSYDLLEKLAKGS
ncbi:MAG: hypothetical protein HYU39_09550 [Thaumarchaeota archaeon]|nr:hypothetical protein [Nitrososphaerota archaeon]